MRILLVEDEERMAQALCEILRQENYEVDHWGDGIQGLYAIETDVYDVAILDVMLPGKNGFEITKEARRQGIRTPILMLTAKSDIDDKVTGLDCGADDYLTKPYAFEELMARIRALVRRNSTEKSDVLTVGDLSVELSTKRVMRGGKEILLSAKEFGLLETLIRHKGQVLSRAQLENQVWDFGFEGSSNIVDVYIRYLRRKVDDPFEKKLIHTIRGAGYVLKEE